MSAFKEMLTTRTLSTDCEDDSPEEVCPNKTTPDEGSSDSELYEDARPLPPCVSDYTEGTPMLRYTTSPVAGEETEVEFCELATDCETSSWTGLSTTGSQSVLDAEVGLSLLEQLRRLQVSLDAKATKALSTGDILRQGSSGHLVLRTNSAYRIWSIFIEKKFECEGLSEMYLYAMSGGPDKYFSEFEESRALQILVANLSVNYHKILYGRSSVVHCLRSLRDRCKPEVLENEAYISLLSARFGDNNNPMKYFQKVRSLLGSVSATRDIKRNEAKLVVVLRANFEKPYKRSARDCTTLTQLESKITSHWIQRKISHAQLG